MHAISRFAEHKNRSVVNPKCNRYSRKSCVLADLKFSLSRDRSDQRKPVFPAVAPLSQAVVSAEFDEPAERRVYSYTSHGNQVDRQLRRKTATTSYNSSDSTTRIRSDASSRSCSALVDLQCLSIGISSVKQQSALTSAPCLSPSLSDPKWCQLCERQCY